MLNVTGIWVKMRKVIKLKSIHQCIYLSVSQPLLLFANVTIIALQVTIQLHAFLEYNQLYH